ncbi:MAG: hypothetical protein IJ972_03325 [Campylobacter sp.]|nr:hypothetical protein [Campylobacter sp.]
MLKNIGENDNIIYGDLSKQLNFKCDFKGKNNIVFFAGRSKNINIIFHSDNNLVFIGNGVRVNGTISLPPSDTSKRRAFLWRAVRG